MGAGVCVWVVHGNWSMCMGSTCAKSNGGKFTEILKTHKFGYAGHYLVYVSGWD